MEKETDRIVGISTEKIDTDPAIDEIERFEEEVVDLIFTKPDINNAPTRLSLVIFIALICVIVNMHISQSAVLMKTTNKYISSQVFLLLFGVVIAGIEYICWEHGDMSGVSTVWISSEMLANFRMPIVVYGCYQLYSGHFARQFVYICIYGIVARFVQLGLVGVIIKNLSGHCCDMRLMSYSQAIAFASVTAITDPLTVFRVFKDAPKYYGWRVKTNEKMETKKNFYLLLGIYIIGNAVAVEAYVASNSLSHFPADQSFSAHCYIALSLRFFRNIFVPLLVGFLTAVLTSGLTRLTRNNKHCEMYEPFITIVGPLLTYLICKWWRINPIFGLLACCLLQERYVFMNMASRSVASVMIFMEALANLANTLLQVFTGYCFFAVLTQKSPDLQATMTFAFTVLAISYLVKGAQLGLLIVIVKIFSSKKRPIGFRFQALFIFAGVRGPRNLDMIIHYNNSPFTLIFQQSQKVLIVWSIFFDTLVTMMLVRSIKKEVDKLDHDEVKDLATDELFPWPKFCVVDCHRLMDFLFGIEKKVHNVVVAREEELTEETREQRERDREKAFKEIDELDETGKRKDPKKDVMRKSGRDALKTLATQDVDQTGYSACGGRRCDVMRRSHREEIQKAEELDETGKVKADQKDHLIEMQKSTREQREDEGKKFRKIEDFDEIGNSNSVKREAVTEEKDRIEAYQKEDETKKTE